MKRLLAVMATVACAASAAAQEAQNPDQISQCQNDFVVPTTDPVTGTAVAQGGILWSPVMVLSAKVHGTDSAAGGSFHTARFELRPISEPFQNEFTHEGNPVDLFTTPAGVISYAFVGSLQPGVSYHWQVQSWKT